MKNIVHAQKGHAVLFAAPNILAAILPQVNFILKRFYKRLSLLFWTNGEKCL